MVILTSAVRSIPAHLSNAARVDGASEWGVLRHVVAPALSQPIRFITIYQALSLMTTYEYILLITGGGPVYDSTPYALYIYRRAFENGAYAYGAALALGLMVIGVVFTLVQWRITDMRSTFAAPDRGALMTIADTTVNAGTDWARLERRGMLNRAGFTAFVLAFLTLVSIPVLLPYLWLMVKSLTLSDDAISHMVLWRSAAIAAVAYAGALGLSFLATRMPRPWLAWSVLAGVVVILAAILVLPYMTLANYRFLWNADIGGTGTNRSELTPSVWSALATSLAFAVTQTTIVTLVATPAAYALSRLPLPAARLSCVLF